jgi:hypothetical protein
MSRYTVIKNLDANSYAKHSLHSETSTWPEKNCYVDLWLELLHALKLEPRAMLPFTVAVDFEGDQWTFFKPGHNELLDLYGIDVQELTVWRPLLEHAVEHLSAGKLISTEADAFWLPDTAGTDYRTKHSKTTIVLNDLDVERRQLSYFHNAGYYRLEGEDFVKTFRLDAAPDPTFLPLFAEFVRIDHIQQRNPIELADMSIRLLRKHLQRIPASNNPVQRFRDRFEQDLPAIQTAGLAHYHAWAFATTRQLGAACELIAANLRWLSEQGQKDLDPAAEAFDSISTGCKTFILKGARVVNSKRAFDFPGTFDAMIAAWRVGMDALMSKMGTSR